MRPVRFVTLDCAETMVRVGWSPQRMADETARSIGLTLPDDAPSRYGEMLAERRAEYVAAHAPASPGLPAFWRGLTEEWLDGYGVRDRMDDFGREADRLTDDPGSGWFTVYPDVVPALSTLREAGIRLGVVSNWDASLGRVLRANGLDGFFEVVVASLVFGHEKPDPRIFFHALERLGATAEETVHVGDLEADDVVGATAARMRSVLIDRSGAGSGAIRTLAELPGRLASMES